MATTTKGARAARNARTTTTTTVAGFPATARIVPTAKVAKAQGGIMHPKAKPNGSAQVQSACMGKLQHGMAKMQPGGVTVATYAANWRKAVKAGRLTGWLARNMQAHLRYCVANGLVHVQGGTKGGTKGGKPATKPAAPCAPTNGGSNA